MIRRIAAITDPAQRLELLRVLALSAVEGPAREFPLHEALTLAIRGVIELRQSLITADESGFLRLSVEGLLRCLNALLFVRFGALTPEIPDTGRVILDARQTSQDDWACLHQYGRLLEVMTNWRLGFYTASQFCESLGHLLPSELHGFHRIKEDLATMLWESFKSPLALQKPELRDGLDRVREFRTLAQSSCESKQTPEFRSTTHTGCARVFLVEVLPAPHHELGLVSFEEDRVILWHSPGWTLLADECHRLLQNFDLEPDRFDQLVTRVQSQPEFQLHRMLADDLQSRRVDEVWYQNLTAFQIPLDCLADESGRFQFVTGPARKSLSSDHRHISFWGQLLLTAPPAESANESSRVVSIRGEEVLHYPELPTHDIRYGGYPIPLPFAFYERWFFDDLVRERRVSVDFRSQSSATRSAFLAADWHSVSALHITTHGFARQPHELSNFMLAEENGSPTRVHFLDILSQDWSSLDLVFLNACLSQAGQKLIGESALSLAWAFLAGGAKSVIACRWQVADALAWSFAKHFYHSWLTENPGSSVRDAFYHARQAVRQYPQFQNPSQWGAFVLIEHPDSD